MRVALSFLLIAIIISGCSGSFGFGPTPTPDPCSPTEIKKYIDSIDDVSRRFDDALQLALSTSRISLSPVVADLQTIRRDAEDLEVPECAIDAKGWLILYIDTTIEAFLNFMAQEPDSQVQSKFKLASQYLLSYQEALAEMQSLQKTATP